MIENANKTLVMTIANRKGGVGKTTNSVNLAYIFTQLGYKVLVIDDDPQGSLTQILGINRSPITNDPDLSIQNIAKTAKALRETSGKPYVIDDLYGEPPAEELETISNSGLHDLITKAYYGTPISRKDIDAAIVSPEYKIETPVRTSSKKATVEQVMTKRVERYRFGFDLIPSSEELTDDELVISLDTDDTRQAIKGLLLIKIVQAIKYYRDYDIILIDTGPSLGVLTVNALAAAQDGIIVSASIDEQSLWSLRKFKYNIRQIKHTIDNHEGILGVILGPVDYKSQLYPIIADKITNVLNLYLFENRIPRSSTAAKATTSGFLFSQLDKKAYDSYCALAEEILVRQAENHAWEQHRNSMEQEVIQKLRENSEYTAYTDEQLKEIVRKEYAAGTLWEKPMSKQEA